MAVNDNDRVTTRRLKEFWQLAKTWVQNFVSDEIDTSEETMSSTMDTKILAAKPDYTKPNINGQIGDGYGYNDMVGNYKSSSGYIGFSGLDTYFGGTATERPFMGNDLIGKQAAYLFSLYPSTNDGMAQFAKDFLKGFEGKLVAFPKTMSADENFTSFVDFVQHLDNFKSTYIEEESCLLSPVWTYGENTYQTKLYKRSGNYNQFAYSLSVNGGAFEEQTPNTGDGLAWCASFNNMPLDIGSCDVADGSVTTDKLANSAVDKWKLGNSAVINDRISNGTIQPAKLDRGFRRMFPRRDAVHNSFWDGIGYASWDNSLNSTIKLYCFSISKLCSILFDTSLPFHLEVKQDSDNIDKIFINKTTAMSFTSSSADSFLLGPNNNNNREYIGFISIKSDIGFYQSMTSCKLSENDIVVHVLDETLLSHRTETNAFCRLIMPMQGYMGPSDEGVTWA